MSLSNSLLNSFSDLTEVSCDKSVLLARYVEVVSVGGVVVDGLVTGAAGEETSGLISGTPDFVNLIILVLLCSFCKSIVKFCF